ncbi:MAG: FlgD immunoglobulin-like domain containing protein [Candidatus Cloacimonas sp.]|jgi:hypothetical protein|nr:FlgD immunoglobulin-like domain containing protein [Candidatus Cloacimonas sp.]
MKSYFTLMLLMLLAVSFALPIEQADDSPKMFSTATHNAGSLSLETSNWGFSQNMAFSQADNKLLFIGAPWISAKRLRRNEQGSLLYWLSPNPSAANSEVITADDPLWNSNLKAVEDTLTTSGFDGDLDIYEFLPAYNYYTNFNPAVPNDQYSVHDVVLKSILGLPAPRPFAIPDPLGFYCFSYGQGSAFDTPGFETLSAYFYDYCPFGTPGERDWGNTHGSSHHYPLGIAVHRESYTWPIQNYDKLIVFKNTIYNSSAQDTLYDIAISEFTDHDIGPSDWGAFIALDDVSGYVKGTGYEFAYARDFDGDGGLSPYLVAQKLYLPNRNLKRAAWFWKMGQGPLDHNPCDLSPYKQTANEKYWLATGRNPNYSYYAPLRPEQDDVLQYEQPQPNDTRILNTMYGSLPTAANPNPEGRMHLAPLESFSYYTIYFLGDSIDELKTQSVAIENWIDNGFDLGNVNSLYCLPYLYDPLAVLPGTFQLSWQSYSHPDHFEVKYKLYTDSATQWSSINLAGTARNFEITGINPAAWYEIKIASVYNPGLSEVYLESEPKLLCINNMVANEDLVQSPGFGLKNYPNPFNPSTTVEFTLDKGTEFALCIYNLKGQVVKVLSVGQKSAGTHKVQWDGRDANNIPCASGIYYLRLLSKDGIKTRKMLLMK